ncbi:MAG TPA: energy transducer TonB [Blastocatellia bacterium]|nr:energy transducer TonB [Blastocatellia bacterium]
MEKQALKAVRRMPVSKLDSALPSSSFSSWFNQVIGPEAAVIWQLTECGVHIDQENGAERDLMACTEADAILPDGRKVVVAINVGTFKKGISGEPVFHSAVIEENNQLYEVRRLRDLPEILKTNRMMPVRLPEVELNFRLFKLSSVLSYLALPSATPYPYPAAPPSPPPPTTPDPYPYLLASLVKPQIPVPPPKRWQSDPPEAIEPPKGTKNRDGLMRGHAILKVNPVYPTNTRTLDPFFRQVVVEVTVSEQGRVTNAAVVRGHPLLHAATLEAARQWIFEPTTINGRPVKVKNILNFVYSTTNEKK